MNCNTSKTRISCKNATFREESRILLFWASALEGNRGTELLGGQNLY
jgi:hypothetical protein